MHYHSQAPLLAVYARIQGHRVRLIGDKDSFEHGWAQSIVTQKSVDKKGDCKSILISEGIDLVFMEDIDAENEI